MLSVVYSKWIGDHSISSVRPFLFVQCMLNNEHISSEVLVGYEHEHGQTTIVYCMVLVCLACSTFVRARVPFSAIYVCNFELVNIVCVRYQHCQYIYRWQYYGQEIKQQCSPFTDSLNYQYGSCVILTYIIKYQKGCPSDLQSTSFLQTYTQSTRF